MIIDYFKIAIRSLSRRKLRSWLTLIGIIIGITSVVALIGLGQGLQAAITGIFGSLGTDKITITATGGFGPPGTGVNTPLTTDDMDEIRRIKGVDTVAGRLLEPGKIDFNDKAGFGYAVSLPEEPNERELVIDAMNMKAEEGRLLKASDNRKIVVGNRVGDLEEYFGKDIVPGTKILVQNKTFEVVGILKKQGNFIFDSSLFMNDDDMRELFDLEDNELDVIVAQVKNDDEIPNVKKNIEKVMRKQRDVKEGEEDFAVSTPQEALDNINSTLGAVNIFVIVIASISILVGGIGIMNSMFMSVTERTRDIGIMKSIGARNNTIFSLFFIESGLLGSMGGLIGATIGALISIIGANALKNFLGGEIEVKAQIDLILFLGSIIGSFVVGSFFGIIPAMRAAKLHPVEALRKKK